MAKWKMMASPRNLASSFARASVPLLFSTVLVSLLDEACVRIAGGTLELAPGGQWEECKFKNDNVTEYATRTNSSSDTTSTGYFSTRQGACNKSAASVVAVNSASWNSRNQVAGDTSDPSICKVYCTGADCGTRTNLYDGGYSTRSSVVSGRDGWMPSTPEHAEDLIASKTDTWTAEDMANPDAKGKTGTLLEEALKAGARPQLELKPVTGPPTVQASPRVEKVTSPDGSTTTTTTTQITNKYTYEGDTVTKTEITNVTTNIVNNTTQQGTTTTTTKEDVDERTNCEKNPAAIECNLDTPDGEIPKSTRTLTYQAESILAGGSCPADKTMTIRGQSVKVWDWQGSCSKIVTYVKPIFLTAATFIALMMLVPGGRPE